MLALIHTVANTEIDATASAAGTSAPRANGMNYDYAASAYVYSTAQYVWVDDLNDPNDYANSQKARHTLTCTSGAFNCSGTTGVARTRAEFLYMSSYTSGLLETTNGNVTGSYAAATSIDDIAGSFTYPQYNYMDGKWYLNLSAGSFNAQNSSYVDQNQPLTASTGTSSMATVQNSVRPYPN